MASVIRSQSSVARLAAIGGVVGQYGVVQNDHVGECAVAQLKRYTDAEDTSVGEYAYCQLHVLATNKILKNFRRILPEFECKLPVPREAMNKKYIPTLPKTLSRTQTYRTHLQIQLLLLECPQWVHFTHL